MQGTTTTASGEISGLMAELKSYRSQLQCFATSVSEGGLRALFDTRSVEEIGNAEALSSHITKARSYLQGDALETFERRLQNLRRIPSINDLLSLLSEAFNTFYVAEANQLSAKSTNS